MNFTEDIYHHWRPSDPSGDCLRFMDVEHVGIDHAGKEYEDFLCLYPSLKPFYMDWEMNWRPFWLLYYMKENMWIPILSLVLYGIMIIGGKKYFETRKPWNLKTPLMLWNLALATFSLVGFVRVLPLAIHTLVNYSWKENICFDPLSHSGHSEAGVWILFFSLSKIAELFDTFFIVVHKKPLILLHWYHHTTVLLYCWYFLVYTAPSALYFCVLNYGVHAVMYSYYFLMSAKMKPKWFNAKFITIIQLVQMVIGVILTVMGVIATKSDPNCHTKWINIVPTYIMYFSYFLLFLKFFINRYYGKGNKKKTDEKKKL